jgi:hypothetical protein
MSHLRRSLSATALVLAIGGAAAMADAREGAEQAAVGPQDPETSPSAAVPSTEPPAVLQALDRVGWP